jgi:hypothetical protein
MILRATVDWIPLFTLSLARFCRAGKHCLERDKAARVENKKHFMTDLAGRKEVVMRIVRPQED